MREVRQLPSGKVEYTLVDEHGNVRRIQCISTLYTHTDLQPFFRKVVDKQARPANLYQRDSTQRRAET